jgi:hypothetical protein
MNVEFQLYEIFTSIRGNVLMRSRREREGGPQQPDLGEMNRTRIKVGERGDQPGCHVFIEQQRRRGECSGGRGTHNAALALRGQGEAGADVVSRQLRAVAEDLFLAHSRSEVRQDVADGDSRSADSRPAETHVGIDNDSIAEIH